MIFLKKTNFKLILAFVCSVFCIFGYSRMIKNGKISFAHNEILYYDTVKSENAFYDTLAKDKIVNINTADASRLTTLDGIGEKTAQAIIDYRNSHGYFSSANELKNIKGIGDEKFNAIKDKISLTD